MQICSILRFSWLILVFVNELQQNSNASSREEYIPDIDCFVIDSSHLN